MHNPALALVEILAGLYNPDGTVAVSGFYDDVVPLAEDERERLGVQKPQEKLIAEAEPAILPAAPDPLVRERLGRIEGEKGKSALARARLKQYGYSVPQLKRGRNNSTIDKPPQHV